MQSEETVVDFYKNDFIDRLRKIRNSRNTSAREMSIALGQNVNYINLIENGKRLPSMSGFFSICEYLCVEPNVFFSSKKSGEADLAFSLLTQAQKESFLAVINSFKN